MRTLDLEEARKLFHPNYEEEEEMIRQSLAEDEKWCGVFLSGIF